MSQRILADEWFELHDDLSNAFSSFTPNPGARASLYYAELSQFRADIVTKAVKTIIKTHHKFPSVADLLENIKTLDPPPDPAQEAAKNEATEWQKTEIERRRLLTAIHNLTPEQQQALRDEANELCATELRQNNVPSWMPFKFLRDCRLFMLYREKYEKGTQY